jgi:hypothetical protein
MTVLDSAPASSTSSLALRLTHLSRAIRRPRGLVILAIAGIALGVGFNWSWLVAAGIAPLLLSTLPCLVMCGLGVCVMCRSGEKQSTAAPLGEDSTPSPLSGVAKIRQPAIGCSHASGIVEGASEQVK